MDLDAYLSRIGLPGRPAADLAGLSAIHRAQAFAVPYDAIDVHLRRPVSPDLPAVWDKIVRNGRGGWCYETNALLGWALRECGFTVRRATGAVYRHVRGPSAEGNHVALIVTLPEGEYLADLGVADFLREPLPLREGDYEQDGMHFRLRRLDDGWWRVHNDPAAQPDDFDFHPGPANEALIARQHVFLSGDPASPFVLTFEAIRMRPGGSDSVVGRVQETRDGSTVRKRLIADADELSQVLRDVIGLDIPGVTEAWPRIVQRHAQIFGAPDAPV